MLSITKKHKPHIHKELTEILQKYSNAREEPGSLQSNIMEEVMRCVKKDSYLAQIFKSFFEQENGEA